ncbi:MAG: YqaJ viral recombinase family protein [PVC group bacterium]|nr:YqaJ viral recombinase family protein [PVC group bacterium]
MIIIDCEQNSDEWYQARLGKPTASNFKKIVTSTGKRSSQRKKYLYELAGEIVTGEKANGYTNANMELGHEREDESRKMYEFINEVKVEQVGFCFFDKNKTFGCSPDGLVGEHGGFETKNAAPHVHLDRLENGWSESEHFQQVQGCLLVTGRQWWDLVSYCRGFKPLIVRWERNDAFIRLLRIEIELFIDELNNIVEKYRS